CARNTTSRRSNIARNGASRPTTRWWRRTTPPPARSSRGKWASASSGAGAPNNSGGHRESRTRIGLDALDHRLESIRALRREVFAQPELVEQRDRVALDDLARGLARVKGEQDRDQPAHDVRVAVAHKGEDRPTRAVRLDAGCEPHLAGAALDFVGVAARVVGQRRQLAAEFDHITVAVVPIVED